MASPLPPPSKEKSLESTATWAVAVVCFVLVAISIVIEQLLHHTELWLKKKRKLALCEALEKIKAELMLLGFISLLLTVTQESLSDICVPKSVASSWHPCNEKYNKTYYDPCLAKGKAQLVSAYGIHQLHIFIFVLALAHVIYCVVTYAFGKLKMRQWKAWEDETKTVEYQYYNDPDRFRFARETSFGRRHLHFWSRSPILLWIVCFFRQFFPSVAKVDYLTLRHGFVTEHLPPQIQDSFDFQIYINRALEEDFKVIVGISPALWFCAVLLLLTNTNGWYSHFWLPFIPLAIILLVGAKLQVIITKMGTRILERGDVVRGSPVVHPSDDLFWFNRPRLILSLIHFVLFENAFQIALFVWSWLKFGYPSCYHENLEELLIRIMMGVVIQVLCSYVTLPLYALVTQMGSNMKPVIFGDDVASGLRGWQEAAKKPAKEGRPTVKVTPLTGAPASPLRGSMSPAYLRNVHRKSTEDLRGGGERSYASPTHHSYRERKDRSPETSVIEIERDVGEPSSVELGYMGQQQEDISSNHFSFGKNDNSTAPK
ncbi:MLO-like protein 6 [Salvia splendens]|uniref:MLO-like protein 6 n=1 Tax=Salvia splendens TaxID=180675 RepID=UPI001C26BAB8|nr:MLO-like protein 6 [Salvia splendens]